MAHRRIEYASDDHLVVLDSPGRDNVALRYYDDNSATLTFPAWWRNPDNTWTSSDSETVRRAAVDIARCFNHESEFSGSMSQVDSLIELLNAARFRELVEGSSATRSGESHMLALYETGTANLVHAVTFQNLPFPPEIGRIIDFMMRPFADVLGHQYAQKRMETNQNNGNYLGSNIQWKS